MAVKHFKGYKPLSFQRAVLDLICTPDCLGKGITVVVKSQRQRGKSLTNINALLYYSLNFSKTKNFYVAPTSKQSKSVFEQTISAVQASGIIKSSNATDLIIKFINGSEIQFKSCAQKENLRGFTCNGLLVCDELSFWPEDVLNIILPWTDFHHANILMTSTPFVKSGDFWTYYNYGLLGQHNCTTVDWCDEKFKEDMLRIMPESRLEEYKSRLPLRVFKMDYLGEFLDGDGSVFTGFHKCVKSNEIGPNDRLWVGVDWAAGNEGDDTAISIINQAGQQVYLAYFNNLTPTDQIQRIEQILLPYTNQIVAIKTELNSLGSPLTDFLQNKSQLSTIKDKFVGFNTTNVSKNAIVQNLQMAFEQGTIEILGDEKQLNELATYTAEYNPKTRNVSYNAPTGLHDDLCVSLALSYDSYLNDKGSTFSISIL